MFKGTLALVVEDDAHSLIAISAILKELGIQYKRNTTGAHVLEQVRQMYPKPDFVLLDTDLPEGDPLVICQSIHDDERLAQIPVIAMCRDENRLRPFERTCYAGILPKPLPRKHAGKMLQSILHRSV